MQVNAKRAKGQRLDDKHEGTKSKPFEPSGGDGSRRRSTCHLQVGRYPLDPVLQVLGNQFQIRLQWDQIESYVAELLA